MTTWQAYTQDAPKYFSYKLLLFFPILHFYILVLEPKNSAVHLFLIISNLLHSAHSSILTPFFFRFVLLTLLSFYHPHIVRSLLSVISLKCLKCWKWQSVINVNPLNSTFWVWTFTNYKFSKYFNTRLSLLNDAGKTLVKCLWLHSSDLQMVTRFLKQTKYKTRTCTMKPPLTNLEKHLTKWFSASTYCVTHPSGLASVEKNWRHFLYSFIGNIWTQVKSPSEFSPNDTSL